MSIWWFLAVCGLLVCVILFDLGVGWRRGRLKYVLKKIINSLSWWLALIWVMYFIIGGVSIVSGITEWTREQMIRFDPSSLAYYVIGAAPYVAMVTILIVAVYIVYIGPVKFRLKYSEKEQEWRREERLKLKRYPIIGRLVR